MYRDAGKSDKATQWAEKGLKAFPDQQDCDLRLLLADEYHCRKRHDEAMALIWANFTDHPGLRGYQDLHKHAGRIGQWPAWRERALSHIRAGIAKSLRKTGERVWDWRKDHSTLVEIFFWEKHIEDAWEEAKAGGCSDELWMRLARWLEKDRPADAIPIYQTQVQRTLRQTGNKFYRQAVRHIREIEKLLKRVNRSGEFSAYLQALRTEYSRKRNFVAMLDKLGQGDASE
jgi:uncharacterized Zn finger protein